jgi:hypothetical protein
MLSPASTACVPLAQELNALRDGELSSTKIRNSQYSSPRSESWNFRGVMGIIGSGGAGSRVNIFICARVYL